MPPKTANPASIPIVQSTTFRYATSEAMGRPRLTWRQLGLLLHPPAEPHQLTVVAAKICALEGGTAAMLTSSGQAANFYAVFNICSTAGDHVVASCHHSTAAPSTSSP